MASNRNSMTDKPSDRTKLVHQGRAPKDHFGAVNIPVWHASTILFDTVEEMEAAGDAPYGSPYYGRRGTPTHFKFQEAIAALEGSGKTILTPSGLSACTLPLMAYTKAGDHVLVTDSVYGPTRKFCDQILKRYGVETEYFAPGIGADIADLIRDSTALIFLESPGSLTFEVQDIPAITAVAKDKKVLTALDNTWATPLFFKPLYHDVDISILAATKYIVGHADAMIGTVTVRDGRNGLWQKLFKTHAALGIATGPDDANLAARGLRTLAVRLAHHQDSAMKVASWLQDQDKIKDVRYPALPGAAGHDIWKRDFQGASGLFAFELDPSISDGQAKAFLNGLDLFGLGYSWGGFESLATLAEVPENRSATDWQNHGPLIRLHIGLEDVDDLITDLKSGLGKL